MRKEILAGIGLVFTGLGVATPAAAEDWRACVVGACLRDFCGDNGASVEVSTATNVDDPALGGPDAMTNALLRSLMGRNQPMTGEPMMQCSPSQPSEEAARQISQRIFAEMSTTFSDLRLVSANDIVPGYDSVPGSEDPRYNGGDSASSDDSSSPSSANDDAAQEQAAAAQRESDAAAERAASARREQEAAAAATAQRERDEAAAAERERERVAADERKREQEAAAQKVLNDFDARNGLSCVTQPQLQINASFEGNTAASVVNGCGQPVDVRICLMTSERGWNCGMTNGLASQASWSWSSFKATGEVFMDARVSGSGRQLLSP